MYTGGSNGHMFEQRLPRHTGVAARIIGRHAPFVAPEDVRFIPLNPVPERIL
jgi:hypothetical protein